MYFESRMVAGKVIAERMLPYQGGQTVVVALSEGAVQVGKSLSDMLRCHLTLLLLKEIILPGENNPLGSLDQAGTFTYNDMFSAGQLEEFTGEYHSYIEQEKMHANSQIHQILGQYGLLERDNLRGMTIILLNDAAVNGLSYMTAANYFKPIRYQKLIAAAPVATVSAVDKLHIIADEIHVLGVTDNFISVDHYYENDKRLDSTTLMSWLTHIERGKDLALKQGRTYT